MLRRTRFPFLQHTLSLRPRCVQAPGTNPSTPTSHASALPDLADHTGRHGSAEPLRRPGPSTRKKRFVHLRLPRGIVRLPRACSVHPPRLPSSPPKGALYYAGLWSPIPRPEPSVGSVPAVRLDLVYPDRTSCHAHSATCGRDGSTVKDPCLSRQEGALWAMMNCPAPIPRKAQ